MKPPAVLEWSEHKTPEGKVYFYNSKSQQSVWDKPKVLVDYEGVCGVVWCGVVWCGVVWWDVCCDEV